MEPAEGSEPRGGLEPHGGTQLRLQDGAADGRAHFLLLMAAATLTSCSLPVHFLLLRLIFSPSEENHGAETLLSSLNFSTPGRFQAEASV